MGGILFISCIRFSIQLFICELGFLRGRQTRKHFPVRAAAAALAYWGMAGAYHMLMSRTDMRYPPVTVCYWFGLFLINMLCISRCYKMPFVELLFVGTGGYAAEHIAFSIGKIVQYTTGLYEDRIGVAWENIIFRFLIYAAVSAAVYFLIIRRNEKSGEFRERDIRVAGLSFLVLFSAIVLSVYASEGGIMPEKNAMTEIVCPIYGFLCCILIIAMQYNFFKENRLSREKEMMEQMLLLAGAQKESAKEAIDIINIKCHDLKHQMKILTEMDSRQLRAEYLEEMKKAVSIYDAAYHTGCESLDYVLREKSLLCDEYEVAFSCMADGGAIGFIHPTDVYALFGNALDNAIEAVLKEPAEKRIISLRIDTKKHMVFVHLDNTCERRPVFEEGLPVTDKEDKAYHGFGVKSIKYIAEKYGGEIMMSAKNGRFCLDIIFPQQGGSGNRI